MESKEILKEFAEKLAGLSAAAKVVAIAGAISTYSGTGYAAEKASVKAESRFITVVEPRKSDVASDMKKEESVAAKTEEVVAPKISEETVKMLLAAEEKEAAKAKAVASKAKIAPKIQEKVNLYESKKTVDSRKPKYDTRFYKTEADRAREKTTGASKKRRYVDSSYSYSSYDAPVAASYAQSSSDDVFSENASTRSTSPSNVSRRSRNRRNWNADASALRTSSSFSEEKKDTLNNAGGIGGAKSGKAASFSSAPSQSATADFAAFNQFRDTPVRSGHGDASAKEIAELRKELELARAKNEELLKQSQHAPMQQPNANAQPQAIAQQGHVVAQPAVNAQPTAPRNINGVVVHEGVVGVNGVPPPPQNNGMVADVRDANGVFVNPNVPQPAAIPPAVPQGRPVARAVVAQRQVAVQPVLQPQVQPANVNVQPQVVPQANVAIDAQPQQAVVAVAPANARGQFRPQFAAQNAVQIDAQAQPVQVVPQVDVAANAQPVQGRDVPVRHWQPQIAAQENFEIRGAEMPQAAVVPQVNPVVNPAANVQPIANNNAVVGAPVPPPPPGAVPGADPNLVVIAAGAGQNQPGAVPGADPTLNVIVGNGAAVPPPPPPPPPPPGAGADGQPVVVEAQGAAVPPPPPPPPGVPTAPGAVAKQPQVLAPVKEEKFVTEDGREVVAYSGGAIPAPKNVPQAPGSAAVPQAPDMKKRSATNLLDALVGTIDRDERKERMQKIQVEKKRQEDSENLVANTDKFFRAIDAAAGSSQAGVAMGIAKSGYLKNIDDALAANAKKGSYALYDGLIRLLSNIAGKNFANLSGIEPNDKERDLKIAKRDGCISLLKTSCPAILRAVAYFEQNDKDVLRAAWEECRGRAKLPDFLADKYKGGDYYALCADCFKKYGIGLSYATDIVMRDLVKMMLDDECVRQNRGDVAFRQEQFPAAIEFAVSLLNKEDSKVEEAISKRIERKYAGEIAEVALDLDKAKNKKASFAYEDYVAMASALQALEEKGVSDDVAVDANAGQGSALDRALLAVVKDTKAKQWYDDKAIEKKLRDSRDKFVLENNKKVMDPPTKQKLLTMVREFNMAFLLSCVDDKYATDDIKEFGKKQGDLRTALKKILKTIQVSSLIKAEGELRQAWDEGLERFRDRVYIFNKKNGIFTEMDEQFRSLLDDLKRDREEGLKKYEEQQTYPIISKIRKAVTDSDRLLKLVITDEEETELMLNNKRLMSNVLKVALKFSKSTRWVLSGKWVGSFLKDLPLKEAKVVSLTLQDASFDNLKPLNDCQTLEQVNFSKTDFYGDALNTLKLRNMKLLFSNTKNTDTLYTDEGILKRLADEKVTFQFRKCPWAVNGSRPVAVAADPVNPQQNGGRRGLRGIGGNGNVAGGNVNGRQQNNPLAGVRLRPRPQDPQGNVPVGERNKNDALANFINNLKAIDNKQERDNEILQFHQDLWEAHAELETVELNVPLATFDMTGSLRDLVKAAVQHANKNNKPLALVGSFNGRHFESIKDITGDIVRGLDGLKTPLQFAFSYEGGYEVEFTRCVLETIDNLKNSVDEPVTNPPQSVELDRIIPKGEMLNALARLKLDTVKFSNLDKCGTLTKDMQGRTTDTLFDAWEKDIDFSEHGWKNLLIKTKTVDFSTNYIRRSLDGLKRLLREMAPGNNAQEGDNPQPPESVRLEEIILPEDMNAEDVTAIKTLVEDLKGGQH